MKRKAKRITDQFVRRKLGDVWTRFRKSDQLVDLKNVSGPIDYIHMGFTMAETWAIDELPKTVIPYWSAADYWRDSRKEWPKTTKPLLVETTDGSIGVAYVGRNGLISTKKNQDWLSGKEICRWAVINLK